MNGRYSAAQIGETLAGMPKLRSKPSVPAPEVSHIVGPLRALAVPVASLAFDEDNARRHPDRNMALTRASLKRFGQVLPIIVQEEGMIVRAGNLRLKLAREMGWSHIAAVVLPLDKINAEVLALADNRTSETAEWDPRALQKLLQRAQENRVDLEQLGWDTDEILANAAAALEEAQEENPVEEPDADEELIAPPKETRTKPGDLWQLGEHRLLCGDSRLKESYQRLLGDDIPQILLTDPPYGVSYVGKTEEALPVPNDDEAGLEDLLQDAFACIDAVLPAGAAIYIAHPAGKLSITFGRLVLAQGWLLHETLIWEKDSIVLGHSDYHYQHEPIIYGWKPGATRAWFGGRDQSTLLRFPRPKASTQHPTMKPQALIRQLLVNSSAHGDVVLDPFGGSGTTLIAAHDTQRKARLIELEPRYCDVILSRWEQHVGRKATLAAKNGSPAPKPKKAKR